MKRNKSEDRCIKVIELEIVKKLSHHEFGKKEEQTKKEKVDAEFKNDLMIKHDKYLNLKNEDEKFKLGDLDMTKV